MTSILINEARYEDYPDLARVHVDVWRSTYTGIVPDEFLQKLSYEQREKMWCSVLKSPRAREHIYVARIDGKVVGFTWGGPLRDSKDSTAGELFAIYLRQQYQGQGIGFSLFKKTVETLLCDGFHSMLLWALEDNPTCKFYRSVGGVPCGDKIEEIGGKPLKEISFYWSSLATWHH